MKGRIDVIHEGEICWSVIEEDGRFRLECDNKRFGMKKLSKQHQDELIRMTVDTFFSRK